MKYYRNPYTESKKMTPGKNECDIAKTGMLFFVERKSRHKPAGPFVVRGYLNAVYRVSVSWEKQPAWALMQWKNRTMSTAEGGPKRQ